MAQILPQRHEPRKEEGERMKDYVLGVLGVLAALGGLAAFAWLCMAASDYGWR